MSPLRRKHRLTGSIPGLCGTFIVGGFLIGRSVLALMALVALVALGGVAGRVAAQ
jgi:hypothetical protein